MTDELVSGFAGLDTSHVSDALDRLGIAGQCAGIWPLDPSFRLAGRAFTVRYVPVGVSRGTVGDYIDDLAPGQVPVLDNARRAPRSATMTYSTAPRRLLVSGTGGGSLASNPRKVVIDGTGSGCFTLSGNGARRSC